SIEVTAFVSDQLAGGRLHDLFDRVVHVFGHLPLVPPDSIVERGKGSPVAILAVRIDGDAVVRIRQDLAVWMNLEPRRVPALDLLLQHPAASGNQLAYP